MNFLISTGIRRFVLSALTFILALGALIWFYRHMAPSAIESLTDEQIMTRLLGIPGVLAAAVLALTTACAVVPTPAVAPEATATSTIPTARGAEPKPFMAQVVGLQWLNPLQRRDYPTEWQLLWTLGLVRPNKNDDMVRTEPENFSTLQAVGIVAYGNEGNETFRGYYRKYVHKILNLYHDIYFSNSNYFYNVHTKDKNGWRELSGIHVELSIPDGRLDETESSSYLVKEIISTFDIGNPNFPSLWSRSTPPTVSITMGGPNAGFTSLCAALDYLQAHPKETVWAMNWDAPSFPPNDEQINENIVQLILAGPDYVTGRAPLAWVGYPATRSVADFGAAPGQPPRIVQAWQAALNAAAQNAGKTAADIGYVIHDADNNAAGASARRARLAEAVGLGTPALDFAAKSFDTPALLGYMGAGTALTDVALAIGYANHLGQNVLVAGTTEFEQPTALLVVPPAKARPIDPDKDWFRARGENHAYLPWWGLRLDAPALTQGFSY